MFNRMKQGAALALIALVLAGCNDSPPQAQTTTSTSSPQTQSTANALPQPPPPQAAAFAGGTTQVSTPESMPGYLTDIEVTSQVGFDRVVFTFSNLTPGYRVGPVNPPFTEDGSGDAVTIAGSDHIETFFTGAGYDSGGSGTQTYNGPMRIQAPSNAVIMTEMARLGDFEGHLNWVVGTSAPAQFKVTSTSNHLVIVDIAPL